VQELQRSKLALQGALSAKDVMLAQTADTLMETQAQLTEVQQARQQLSTASVQLQQLLQQVEQQDQQWQQQDQEQQQVLAQQQQLLQEANTAQLQAEVTELKKVRLGLQTFGVGGVTCVVVCLCAPGLVTAAAGAQPTSMQEGRCGEASLAGVW
jgi:ABC-type transporter Mla subunit MlaD